MTAKQMPQTQTREQNLKGKKVAILVTDGFEQVEMTEPRKALDAAGAQTSIVSPKDGQGARLELHRLGRRVQGRRAARPRRSPDDFDALLLPGGVINPDTLRMDPKAVDVRRRRSSTPASRWRRSATGPGRSSRPARRRAADRLVAVAARPT